jgi:hypothetical protein
MAARTLQPKGLTLAGLEAAVGLVDHIGAAMTAHDLAIAMASLQALEAVANLHGKFRLGLDVKKEVEPLWEGSRFVNHGCTGAVALARQSCDQSDMKSLLPLALSLALLAGCASGPAGVEVTRFHLSQPLAGASIAVVPADTNLTNSLAFRAEADAVLAELVRAGFRAAEASESPALTAAIRLERGTGERPRRSGLSIGLGGGLGGRRGGFGTGVNIPVTGTTQTVSNALLTLQIRRAGDPSVVWEGRATASGTPADVGAGRLARALLGGFPGPSGQTVVVKPAP